MPSVALLTDLYELTMAYGYWRTAKAEDEAAFHTEGQTVMIVPTELVPAIRRMLGQRRGA